jgi:hypothetical protein
METLILVIRSGLVLAATSPSGSLRVPTKADIGDDIVIIECRDNDNWVIVTKSTGCPPACSFVPPVRLQKEDPANADALGEALLSVYK